MKVAWQLYFSRPNKRTVFILSILMLGITLLAFVYFLTFNESRPGYILNDPILNSFHPTPLSEYIFFITYVLSIYGLIAAFKEPALFVNLLQAYTLMTLTRMLCMYLVPLEAPATIIPLEDSFLQYFFYSGRDNLKDLFFSGHTATLFLLAFCFRKKSLKRLFAAGACVVGALLVLQHVHFSIDVAPAPAVAYAAVTLQKKLKLN